ncbi:MAG: nucleotidyltransferase domain-containing protein [Kofleriaceae bacterium]
MEVLIENLTTVLRVGPPLRLAVLFGSRATGRARAASDVDLAILPCDGALALGEELDLAARLSLRVGHEVDLVRIDRASTTLAWQIARDGVLLLAEPATEWVRFRANAASEHADTNEALHRAAELFRRHLTRPTL